MRFKKLKKEDMPIVIISIVIVLIIMLVSAISSLQKSEDTLTFGQWIGMNLFVAWIAFVMDFVIIMDRRKKEKKIEAMRQEEINRKTRAEKEMTVFVNIKSGALGINGIWPLHQLFENGLFYFGDRIDILYKMIEYEWDGAKYRKVTKMNKTGIDRGKTGMGGIASGNFKIAGAVGNIKTTTSKQEKGETIEEEIEEMGSAIIRMKNINDDKIYSFIIECNSELDKMIRCFNNIPHNNTR